MFMISYWGIVFSAFIFLALLNFREDVFSLLSPFYGFYTVLLLPGDRFASRS